MQHHLRQHASTVCSFANITCSTRTISSTVSPCRWPSITHVRLLTYSGGDYLEGAVSLSVWLDSAGIAPIVSGSSSVHEFDVTMPTNYKGITIPFEQIAEIHVVSADQNFGQFHVH
jgi:hypothetical protein